MFLVGIVGHIASGKSIVAKYLEEQYQFVPLSFGDGVKDVTQALHLAPTRENLQELGTEVLRKWRSDIWVRVLDSKLNAREAEGDSYASYTYHDIFRIFSNDPIDCRYVIPDVRFPNEANYIANKGGLLIGLRASLKELYRRVQARKKPTDQPLDTYEKFLVALEHESERHIEDLFGACVRVFDTLGKGQINEFLGRVGDYVERELAVRRG